MKPQGIVIEPQSAPVTDDAPGLFSRAWYLCLVSIAQRLQVLKDAVLGWAKLQDVGHFTLVVAPGEIGQSVITDDGVVITIDSRVAYVQKSGDSTLCVVSTSTGGNANLRLRNGGAGKWLLQLAGYSSNGFQIFDETNNCSKMSIATGPAGIAVLPENVGVGPTQGGAAYALDAKGDINATGKYRVAGTQVVGPRGGAIAVPTGGGTAVTAPAGGTVIDVQARNAIAVLIAAVGSGGNSVDPNARAAINSIINALSSASGHGLIT